MTIAQTAPDGNPHFQRTTSGHDAREIRRNHQQLQHVINRMLTRLGVPDKAARGISGIHGVLNGMNLPVKRAHTLTARQLYFKGKDHSADTFMCRVLKAIDKAEARCGRRFFKITRGNRDSGEITSYDADYIGEEALRALLEAKASPMWPKNPSKAISDEVIDRAIDRLPKYGPAPMKTDGPSITDGDVIKAQWSRILGNAEKNLIRELESGADPVLAAKAQCDRIMKRARDLKENYTREKLRAFSSPALDDEEDEEALGTAAEETPASDLKHAPLEGAGGNTPPPQFEGVDSQIPQENDSFSEEDLTAAALAWAARGMAVLPLYGVADGVCDCRKGSECDSPGKHPLPRLAPHGVKDATTDPERIRAWWEAAPLANVGIAMGGPLRLLAVDVDPRAGGDASLCDLVEEHGDEWLSTLTVKTGGLGNHFIYRLPEGVEIHRGKLAPGIDIKADDGYLVAAPSTHASGRRYVVERQSDPLEAPAWLVEELTREPGGSSAKVIQFQEGRRALPGNSSRIPEGERNDSVFKIGCAMWGAGEVADLEELYSRLINEVYPRCDVGERPFTLADVRKIARSIMRYPRGAAARR